MDMKQKVGPAAIALSVVALLIVVFLIYHFTMGGNRAQPPITADNRPEYVKELQRGGRPSWVPLNTQTGSNAPTNTGGQTTR